jgi:hypothetical protein
MSGTERLVCAGGCGQDLDAIDPPLRRDATVCREEKCRKAAQRACKAAGHSHFHGRCTQCGAYCLRPRLARTKRARRMGQSPNIDLSWRADAGPSNMRSNAGQLLIDHTGGPLEEDILTLTGGERAIPSRGSAWNVLQHISLIERTIAGRKDDRRQPQSYGDSNRVWLDPPDGLLQWRERGGSVVPLSEIHTIDDLAPGDAEFDELEEAA